jgi:predicted nucleic acid-binding protein
MIMESFVFDTGALSLFFADDQRLRPVVDKIGSRRAHGILSSVTLAEFFYKTCQTLGREVATLWSTQLSERMQIIDVDLDMSMAAGREKCRNSRLSLADAFVLALSKRVGGVVVTTDSELTKNKDVRVRFFRV